MSSSSAESNGLLDSSLDSRALLRLTLVLPCGRPRWPPVVCFGGIAGNCSDKFV
jgi:hypothetical protein